MRTAIGGGSLSRWTAIAVVAAAVAVAAVAMARFGVVVLPAAVGLAALGVVFTTRSRHVARDAVLAVGAGVTSTLFTAAAILLHRPTRSHTPDVGLAVLEVGALLGLILLVVRAAPARLVIPAVLPAGIGTATWILRFGPPDLTLETLAGCTIWGLSAVGAVAVGLYLRSLENKRVGSI